MATFNGGAYIRQQILSIIAQTHIDWKLYIHDDGSTDDTIEIIKELQSKYPQIELIEDGQQFHSPALNFIHLLKFSTADFICFCDQDDIWIENKLSRLLLEAPITSVPLVVVSEGYLFNSKDNLIIGRFEYKINTLRDLLFVNGGVHGSRCMINRAMKEAMLKYVGSINMHDHLMTQIGCSFGEIKYIDTPLFFYRQHTHNVTGNITSSRIRRLINGFSSLGNKFLVSKEVYNCNAAFLSNYESSLSSEDKQTLNNYLSIKNRGYLSRLFLILKGKFSICANARLQLLVKAATRRLYDA